MFAPSSVERVMNRRDFFSGGLAIAAGTSLSGMASPGEATAAEIAVNQGYSGMIAVMAELLFERGDAPLAAKALSELAAATQHEPGCIRYVVAQDLNEPGRFHLSELWKDVSSLGDHFATEHVAAFSSAARGLGYSAPYLKKISVARISDFKPSELSSLRGG
jgi:quinol monooxygenase YgiN